MSYRAVIETLLTATLIAILALSIWSVASGQPTRMDIITEIDNLQRQMTIMNCQINAETEAESFECEALQNDLP